MNVVNSFLLREQGKRLWRDYNIALKRLKCYDYDEFRGIMPSTEGPDFNPEPPVFACSFCNTPNQEHLLALANEDGKIAIQDTTKRSDHNPFEGHQAHHNAIFDIAWAPNEMRLVSASGDHTAILWDVQESGQLQEVARFHAHTRSVKTVAFPRDDKMIFATGARDGVIMLWDTRIPRNQLAIRPDNYICNSHSAPGTPGTASGSRNRRAKSVPSRASSITGLLFQDGHSLISCGAGDGKVKVWDIRKSYSTYRREPQPQYCMSTPNGSGRSGFTCLALDPGGVKLYASCMDNTIYCYNVSTYEEQPVGIFKGHKNGTFYVKACLSPDGRYLLSGSSDEHAFIWDTCHLKGDAYLPIVKLVGHAAEVTSVAWCPVGEVKIVTCSDDARHCLWRVGLEEGGDNDQVELHGWAEALTDGVVKNVPTTPVTPGTLTFTSYRRWTPIIQKTPDNVTGPLSTACELCHHLSTPCLRCIAMRAPLPVTVPHGSKKRLEVLWEEDGVCPECEREANQVLNPVSSNVDALARQLFSTTPKRSANEMDSPMMSVQSHSKEHAPSPNKRRANSDNFIPETFVPSPKKRCLSSDTASTRKTSPRKRLHISPSTETTKDEIFSPKKRYKINENAGTSKDGNVEKLLPSSYCRSHKFQTCNCSPQKKRSTDLSGEPNDLEEVPECSPSKIRKVSVYKTPVGAESQESCLPSSAVENNQAPSSKRCLGTPAKRRISDRQTDSPHKRLPLNDDLQGISKIDDNQFTLPVTQNRPRVLCARHRRTGFSSPTLNLPNYILDGTSPHHKCSPVHQHKENVDWLTQLRRERNSTEKKQDSESSLSQDATPRPSNSRKTSSRSTPSRTTPGKSTGSRSTPAKGSSSRTTPAKVSSRTTPAKPFSSQTTPTAPSQIEKRAPRRRPSNSESSLPASGSNAGPSNLLRFFRVSEKPTDQCSLGSTPPKTLNSVALK